MAVISQMLQVPFNGGKVRYQGSRARQLLILTEGLEGVPGCSAQKAHLNELCRVSSGFIRWSKAKQRLFKQMLGVWEFVVCAWKQGARVPYKMRLGSDHWGHFRALMPSAESGGHHCSKRGSCRAWSKSSRLAPSISSSACLPGQPSHGNFISLGLPLTFFWHPHFFIVFHNLSHVYMLLPSVPSAWRLIFEKSAWAELWNPSGSPDRQFLLFLQAPRGGRPSPDWALVLVI